MKEGVGVCRPKEGDIPLADPQTIGKIHRSGVHRTADGHLTAGETTLPIIAHRNANVARQYASTLQIAGDHLRRIGEARRRIETTAHQNRDRPSQMRKKGPLPKGDKGVKQEKEKKPPKEYTERDMPKLKTPEPVNIVAQNQFSCLGEEEED